VNARARLLVVDDEQSMREFLDIFFRKEGYEVQTASSVDEALAFFDACEFDVVISDIQMPDRTGIELLSEVQRLSPETVMIMITAFSTTETAIDAMKLGAYDYITKPFKVDEIRLVVEKALEKKLLSSENIRLQSALKKQNQDRPLIGNSSVMRRMFDLVCQVAETRTNVLIYGESGTGKELVARAIHANSDRSNKPFVAVNCGAIPENLLESELFGHMKGSFTGAVGDHLGLFAGAESGTILLDEIGELPLLLQVKLLRVLQERRIRPVGSSKDQEIDVRIVAATNRDLESSVREGTFREDLYYRLNVIQIELPSLRERIDDLPLLVHHFVEKFAKELGKTIHGVSDEMMSWLHTYSFPGNVRELENIIERGVALTRGEYIEADCLPTSITAPQSKDAEFTIPSEGVDLEALVADYERRLLRQALERAGGIKKKAAQLLHVSFRSFRYRLEKLGLDDSGEAE
jgi:two-component system response regulator PilR (NtrC family)